MFHGLIRYSFPGSFPLCKVTAEGAGWSEFTQAVTDHVFRDVDGHMAATIMYSNGMADHLREDHARPAPGANHLLFATLVHSFDFFQ
jgi:hypothetical protein